MAQPIQVSQTTPNAPQFQVPTDLVNAYLNRQTQASRDIAESINNFGNIINQRHQQQIQNQLAALGAVSQLYGAGGPRAVQQYAPALNQTAGTQLIPQQTAIPPQGTPQNATLPPNQDQSPSPYIQASLAAGHPDVAGVGSFHAPQPSPEDVQDIASGGTYGLRKGEAFKNLGDLAMQPLTAQQKQNEIAMNPLNVAEKQANIRAQNSKYVTPDQANALASGDPSQVSQQFGQGATVPVEAVQFSAGQHQQKQNKSQEIEKSYQDKNTALTNAIQAINSSLELKRKAGSSQGPIRGGIASVVGDVTHGAMQDAVFQLNRNNELQRSTLQHVQEVNRFNPQEVGYIGGGALAQPGEPLKVSEEKAAQAIKVLKQRLQQNLVQKNAELSTQGLPASKENFGEPTGLTGPHGQTVVQNGHTYTWNGKQYE